MIRRTLMGFALGFSLATGAMAFAEAKIPNTPQEHFALAKQYQEKAEAARKEVVEHRKMAEAYRNSPSNAQQKGYGQNNPWVMKMEKHCQAIAEAADKLATENLKAAEFHTLRGKELQGK